MRTLTTQIENELISRSVRIGILVFINHPSGDVRVWSGLGTIQWDGFSWIGLGKLGRIQGIGETTEIRTSETQYQLAGVTIDATAAQIIAQPIYDREAKTWLAFLSENMAVLPDPILIDQSNLDYAQAMVDEDLRQWLTLFGRSAIYDFRRPTRIFITNEQQQFEHAGDTGFDRIPTEVVDKEIKWTPT